MSDIFYCLGHSASLFKVVCIKWKVAVTNLPLIPAFHSFILPSTSFLSRKCMRCRWFKTFMLIYLYESLTGTVDNSFTQKPLCFIEINLWKEIFLFLLSKLAKRNEKNRKKKYPPEKIGQWCIGAKQTWIYILRSKVVKDVCIRIDI